MNSMTVRDLIEELENLPMDLPITENGYEITEVLIRDEIYLSEDHKYKEGLIIKVY